MRIGQLQIEGEIARGGMGAVYRARTPSGEAVAVKLVHTTLLHAQVRRQRFRTEVKALRRLTHPNIVRVHDAGEHEGQPYLVMDLVEGESIADRLGHAGPFPPVEAAEIVHHLARAMEHAHQQKLLHRDLKPSNVLLSSDGRARITDFGLAKDLDASQAGPTQSGTFLGSPGYWAPEQATGQRDLFGPAMDVYGLGATLYAMLTGFPPIEGESLMAVLSATQTRTPELPSARNPAVPAELDAICMRCLEKDPHDRYASAADLADALEDFTLSGATTRRNPARLALVALAAVALLVAGGVAAALASRSSPDEPVSPVTTDVTPDESDTKSGLAEEATARARALYDQGAWAEAAAAWAEVARLDPSHEPLEQCALSLLNAKSYPEALDAFYQALERDPLCSDCYGFRAIAHWDQGDADGALEESDRALKLDPQSFRALIYHAAASAKLGRQADADRDLAAAAALELDSTDDLLRRANCLSRTRQHALALVDLERLVQREPGLLTAHSRRAVTLLELERYAEAVEVLDTVIEMTPPEERGLHYGRRAFARTILNRDAEAIADYTAAIKVDPDTISHYENRAQLIQHKDLQAALADYDAVLALEPGHTPALLNRSQLRSKAGDKPGAIEDLQTYQRINPESLLHIDTLLDLLIEVKDTDGALAEIERALSINPRLGRLHHRRGTIYANRERFAQAKASYDRALELSPKLPLAWADRGAANLRLQDWEAAITDFDTAVKLMGTDFRYRTARATVQRWRAQCVLKLPSTPERDLAQRRARIFLLNQGKTRKERDQALRELEAAVARYPRALDLLIKQGTLLAQGDRNLRGALTAFTKALTVAPGDMTVYMKRAEVRVRLEDLSGAIADFDQAVHHGSGKDLQKCYRRRAQLRERTGDMAGALADLRLLSELDPKGGATSARLIEFLERRGDPVAALAEADRAIGFNPGSPNLFLARARILTRQKQFAGAEAAVQRAMDINPTYGMVWACRGRLRAAQGEHRAALKDFDKALELLDNPFEAKRRESVRRSRAASEQALQGS